MKKIKLVSSSLFIIILAVVFYVESFNIVRTNKGVSVGPALIPQVIIIVLFVLAIINWILTNKGFVQQSEKSDKGPFIKLFSSMALFLLCVLSLEALGFILSGSIFLSAEVLLLDPKKIDRKGLIKTICTTVAITVLTYLLFNYAFQVSIPKGFFG